MILCSLCIAYEQSDFDGALLYRIVHDMSPEHPACHHASIGAAVFRDIACLDFLISLHMRDVCPFHTALQWCVTKRIGGRCPQPLQRNARQRPCLCDRYNFFR